MSTVATGDPVVDPVVTDPEFYSVVFENDRVRVLEYRDEPGACTHEHSHPDMVIIPLTTFRRRLTLGDRSVEVEKKCHEAGWVDAQTHIGENIGTSPSHALFVELK